MPENRFLAFDLGAESGRAVVGTLADGRLTLEEIHRFSNEPVEVCGTWHWDILCLYNNVLKGMREYVQRFGDSVDGIGIDTWGVDFGLLAKDGSLLESPVCYRDRRTEGMQEQVLKRISAEDLFQRTGMALLPIQTLFQLFSIQLAQSSILAAADTFLMMPDLLAYFLTGEKRCERTNAISTQLYDPRQRAWCEEIFKACDLPFSLMAPLMDPGTLIGEVCDSVKRDTGLKSAPVIAPCTHDTPSAVAAVPGRGDDWAFISSGTWSVAGALSDEVVTTPDALSAGLCNEVTLGSFFLCRNIMGLWLLQQARAVWQRRGEEYSYEQLVELAEKSPESGPVVNPDDPSFLAPEDMEIAIRDYCTKTGQQLPQGPADITRCILESLALSYRHGLDRISRILGRKFSVLHIVGGGSLNALLCQLAANVTGIPVVAGPVEATTAGNVLVQALARGYLASPQEIRDVVRVSFTPVEYEPKDIPRWQAFCDRNRQLFEQTEP